MTTNIGKQNEDFMSANADNNQQLMIVRVQHNLHMVSHIHDSKIQKILQFGLHASNTDNNQQ